MKFLLLRALPLALYLAAVQPIFAQMPAAAAAQPSASSVQNGPVYNLTAAQWREDLRFMAAEMERRHKNLYHTVSREEFAAAVSELDARIPTLQRNEIIVSMMRIAAMVGDGHTRIDPRKDEKFGFPSLPLKLYLFEDGLYVRAATSQNAGLIGARIEAIGGVPVEQAIRRVRQITSADNEMGYAKLAPVYLNMPDILHALKMSPRRDVAVLKLRKGNRVWTTTVPAGQIDPPWPADTDISLVTPKGWVDARTAPPPLWLQAPLDNHRLIELPEQKALYAQVNMIADIKGQSLGQFGEMIRKQAHASKARAVIVDFRLAHGGNHSLRNRFISEVIKTEDEDTRLFVLSGRGSYSATEALLVDLNRLTDAVLAGEPASSKPNSFGDAYRSSMPNSGISFRSSIYWNQLAGQSKDPWTGVDLAVPLTFADHAAGRDPVVETALNHTPKPPLRDQLIAAAKTGGVPGVIKLVNAYRSNVAHRYLNLGLIIPQAAERLYGAKYGEEAFAVAELAAKAYPESVDAWVVLAYVAHWTKRPDVALRAVQRTLELAPDNRPASDLLQKLKDAR